MSSSHSFHTAPRTHCRSIWLQLLLEQKNSVSKKIRNFRCLLKMLLVSVCVWTQFDEERSHQVQTSKFGLNLSCKWPLGNHRCITKALRTYSTTLESAAVFACVEGVAHCGIVCRRELYLWKRQRLAGNPPFHVGFPYPFRGTSRQLVHLQERRAGASRARPPRYGKDSTLRRSVADQTYAR